MKTIISNYLKQASKNFTNLENQIDAINNAAIEVIKL